MTPDLEVQEEHTGHLRRALGGSKELVRIAYRDPEHISERLTLLAAHNLAEPSREWAERTLRANPDSTPTEIADRLRTQTAKIARVDGAVAGTPFFIALVPGYLSYLVQEARMNLRTAALFGRDPGALRTSAEMLALRGVHPTVDVAEAALKAVEAKPPPVAKRRSLSEWVRAVRMVLVFGGFLGPPSTEERETGFRARVQAVAATMVGMLIWATTWVVPITFIILMAWGCETHARQLGRRVLALYDGEAETTQEAIVDADREVDRGHGRRQALRSAALILSVAIPVGFVAYADHVRQDTGVSWIGALGALVALSFVIAAAVYGRRR